MDTYHPFDPDTRAPSRPAPAGACDAQFHVFGSPDTYPPRREAGYTMPTATIEEALKMHRTLGIGAGVIVQATTYGLDHQAMLDALAAAGPGYRGCAIAVVLLEGSEAYIQKLHDAGVRGARFNLLPQLNMIPSEKELAKAIDRMREMGWYAKIQPGPGGAQESLPLFDKVDIPVLIDHFGRPSPGEGPDGPTVSAVREWLKRPNFWMMLTNGYRYSEAGYPWQDIVPSARAYIEAAPERVVWGTDWPHPLSKAPPPNDADILELIYSYTSDEAQLRKILVDNPRRLFGLEPADTTLR